MKEAIGVHTKGLTYQTHQERPLGKSDNKLKTTKTMGHETDSSLEGREINGVGCPTSILKFLVKVQDVKMG